MKYTWITVVLVAIVATAGAGSSNPYLQAPIFQNLPPMEWRIETQFGYGDSGDLPCGLLAGFGVGLSDALTVGAYGQVNGSDRDLPAKSGYAFGLGGFAEYAIQLGYTLVPYVGVRLGMLDLTGPGSPTLPYAAGIVGATYPLTDKVSVSAAFTFHVAGESGGYSAYNYERSGDRYSADKSDLTVDVGLRYRF
jgi:hypothetical protein